MDADIATAWITVIAEQVSDAQKELTDLDSAIGDGDHGSNLARGFKKAQEAIAAGDDSTPGKTLMTVGKTLVSSVGGASGPLYGTAFRRAGKAMGDAEHGTPESVAQALQAAFDGVSALGSAKRGEKTMLDALGPAVDAFKEAAQAGENLASCADKAAAAAEKGADDTVDMKATKGRASYLGERSKGHKDPGAASTAIIMGALRDVLKNA